MYQATLDEWRPLLVELHDLKVRYSQVAEDSELEQIRQQFAATVAKVNALIPVLRERAIAAFQEALFTSDRARSVARQLAFGVPVEHIQRPELKLDDLTEAQARGLEVYNAGCEPCHGGATTTQIVNREVHDFAFVQLKPDGNVLFDTSVQPPVPVFLPQPDNEFLNIGLANISALGQLGFLPTFNADVELPRYRYRFYTDGTRTTQQVDLPPLPVTATGNPLDLFYQGQIRISGDAQIALAMAGLFL